MIVHKYGGSSVSTNQQIKQIAEHLKDLYKTEKQIVVVVSAMGKTTNNLINELKTYSTSPPPRELDSLLSTGEIKSTVYLATALSNLGVPCISLTGRQAGIKTFNNFNHAFIKIINPRTIKKYLDKEFIVIVAGFQGVNSFGETTTLGRGGSDTTAVAISAVLNCPCEIYTNVNGVYKIDPHIYPNAKKLDEISYNEMMELSVNGAKVFEPRSIELAKKFNVELRTGKSLSNLNLEGTKIMNVQNYFEKPSITGITIKENLQLVTLSLKKISANKAIEIISKYTTNYEQLSISNQNINFVIEKICIENFKTYFEPEEIIISPISKISVVCDGIATHKSILESIIEKFQKNKIEITNLILSETVLSFTIIPNHKEKAISILTNLFNL